MAEPWSQEWSPFWAEKISTLLLAAHLDGLGWRPLLTVPSAELESGADPAGLDWALCVKAVIRYGGAFPNFDDGVRAREYARTEPVTPWERETMRRGLPSLLESLVLEDKQYRYDGIWHDDGGNVDLIATHPEQRVQQIEAKGPTAAGTRINASESRGSVRSLFQLNQTRHGGTTGILIPDDGAAAVTGDMVKTLLSIDISDEQRAWTLYLVDDRGRISTHNLGKFVSDRDKR